jgi:hypothetical protein
VPDNLFVWFELREQFFSYLATVTSTSDRAANLDLCLALTAFSSEGSFTCYTYCDTGPPFLRSYPKDPWFSLLNTILLAKEQSLPILNVLGLTRPARAGLELTTFRLLSESTITRLQQPVHPVISRVVFTVGDTCVWNLVDVESIFASAHTFLTNNVHILFTLYTYTVHTCIITEITHTNFMYMYIYHVS